MATGLESPKTRIRKQTVVTSLTCDISQNSTLCAVSGKQWLFLPYTYILDEHDSYLSRRSKLEVANRLFMSHGIMS